MTAKEKGSEETWKDYVKYAISAFVSVTHVITFFQIVICSRHLAVAFNIPAKNIGIYFAKLYSLRSLLMSMGCAVEYTIYRIIQTICSSDKGELAKKVRRYSSTGWFVLLTICEVSFLIVLYSSKNVAYHNYIVLNLEGLLFGFFQMSILSLIPEFVPYYMLSLYVSGTCIFIIQTIIDRCTKNSMLSVKIQSWICVLCSLICVGIWPVRLFVLEHVEHTLACNAQTQSQQQSQPQAQPVNGASGSNGQGSESGGGGGGSGPAPATAAASSTSSSTSSSSAEPAPTSPKEPESKVEYLMTMTSLTILKIMATKLDGLCKILNSQTVMNVQILITRLQQIRSESQITYDMLVAIDLVILALRKCECSESELCLLAELSLFLRMKVLIKPLEQKEQSTIQQASYAYGSINVKNCKNGGKGEPVLVAAGRYMGLVKYDKNKTLNRKRRSIQEETQLSGRTSETSSSQRSRRQKRNTETPAQPSKAFHEHLLPSLSQMMMFPIGSLVKDFLFPGVIPYGLLERDKCHLINLIVIIFLSIGPLTIFIMQQTMGEGFRKDNKWIHLCWTFMMPKVIILIISLCAIHTKQGCTHKIRSSQGIVLFMTMILLTCYGFLETMSFVGMGHYVKFISGDFSGTVDLLAIHNVSGKFFRYFVYKLSVGYNKTRIGSGFVLPNFEPPEPIPNTFCYWFLGAFSNGGKDIKGDFRMGIKQYLAVSEAVSKKSPIDTLRFCDVLM